MKSLLPKAASLAARVRKPAPPVVLPPPPHVPEARMRAIALHLSRRLDGILQAEHARIQIGPGSESGEARLYGVGDDARRIDWAATARTGQTQVRSTIADRELETTLVVDLSASMAFGTRGSEKRDLALAVATGLVHRSSGHGDRVGAVVITANGLRRVPARGGRDAAMALQHVLARTPRTEQGVGPSLAEALVSLTRPAPRRGLIVVISDLLEPGAQQGPSAWERPLRLLTQRCEVLVVQIQDRRESELPDIGTLHVVDPETGRLLEVRTTGALRERYAAAAAERSARQLRAVREAGARYVRLRTDEDWLPALARALSSRHPLRSTPSGAARV